MPTADQVVVELDANVDKYNAKVAAAAKNFASASGQIAGSAAATEKSVNSVGAAFQRGSVASNVLQSAIRRSSASFAAGLPVATIFGEQIERVAEVAELAGGSLGSVGAFLGGPWGIALTAAIAVLTPFVGKLFEGGEAADDQGKAAKSLTEAIADLDVATGKETQTQEQAAVAAFRHAAALRQQAIDARNATKASLESAIAQAKGENLSAQGPGQRSETAAIGADISNQRVSGLQTLLAQNEADIAKSTAAARRLVVPLLQQQVAEQNKATAATNEFARAQSYLNKQVETGAISQAKYRTELAKAQAVRDSASAKATAAGGGSRRASTGRAVAADKPELTPAEIRDQEGLKEGVGLDITNPGALVNLTKASDTAIELARNLAIASHIDFSHIITTEDAERLKHFTIDVGKSLKDAEARGLDSLTDGLTKAIDGTESLGKAFKDVANGIIQDLIRIGVERSITEPLANALFGGGSSSGGGGLGGILGSIFGGGRANGGNVVAGKIYKINENGPELFSPASNGKIYPTGSIRAAQGGSGITVLQTVAVDARGSVMNDQFARQILARADQNAKQITGQGMAIVRKGIPADQSRYAALGTPG